MARRPNVRWSESAQRWMAWVRFPDGSRRKVERTNRADAQRDLDALLAVRDGAADVGPSRQRLATFADVLDRWIEAGCPRVSPNQKTRHARDKAPNTLVAPWPQRPSATLTPDSSLSVTPSRAAIQMRSSVR